MTEKPVTLCDRCGTEIRKRDGWIQLFRPDGRELHACYGCKDSFISEYLEGLNKKYE